MEENHQLGKTMKPGRTSSRIRKIVTAFAGDQSGAVAVYVVILMAVLVGFVGLAVDVGRLYTTHSQAQAAADAAALAAATQLDGEADAIQRATIAAMSTPLVNNSQDFAEGDATVQIVQLRFLKSLPAHDDDPITNANLTTDPTKAAYVEATTETLTQLNRFMAAVGAGSSDTLATAVAGNNTLTCKVPPLMICNPWEGLINDATGLVYTPSELDARLSGATLLAKTVEGGIDSWAPGAMALLDPPPSCANEVDGVCTEWDTSTNNGTKQVALSLARVPKEYCYAEFPLSVRTGQANAMRSAVNIWFDIYENPYFGGAKYRNDPDFRPARNVTKGWITDWVETPIYDTDGVTVIGTSTSCESTPVDDPNVAFGLPPDDCFAPSTDPLNFFNPVPCGTSLGPAGSEARIGDGVWNIKHYWHVNHDPTGDPSADPPYGACATNPLDSSEQACLSAGMTRYQMYQYEIWTGAIPNNDDPVTPTVEGENGNPICYGGGSSTLTDSPDRRKLSVAVINCQAWGITGNSVPSVDAEYFAEMFVLRPIRGSSDYNIWLEFVSIKHTGDEAVHDVVQLYR